MEDAQAVLRGSLCVYVVLDCNQTSLNLTYIARLLVCYNAPQTWKLRQSASSLASFFPTDRRESLPTCRRRAHARYMPPTFTGFDTSSAILQSGGPKNVWTDNEKTRTALGDAIHWFPAYNDGVKGEVARSLGIGFGEVSNHDNRARGGEAAWGDPVVTENIRFGEK